MYSDITGFDWRNDFLRHCIVIVVVSTEELQKYYPETKLAS